MLLTLYVVNVVILHFSQINSCLKAHALPVFWTLTYPGLLSIPVSWLSVRPSQIFLAALSFSTALSLNTLYYKNKCCYKVINLYYENDEAFIVTPVQIFKKEQALFLSVV